MQLLKALYSINSKSGNEKEIKDFVLSYVHSLNAKIKFTEDKKGNLFFIKGEADSFPCVVAHLDEVYLPSVRNIIDTPTIICAVNEKGERVGIGADDKNGIWIALNLLKEIENIKIAFFVEEEKDGDLAGCRGSNACDLSWFEDVKYVIECDRKGNSDFIIQAKEIPLCDYDFIPLEILKKYSYWPTKGGNTDVGALKRRGLSKPCCNISCGYYNAHKSDEYTNVDDLNNCLDFVREIINQSN